MNVLFLSPLLAALAFPAAAQVVSAGKSLDGIQPALYVRHLKGPRGLTNEQLAQDLTNTAANIHALIVYIKPYKEGVAPPQGDDLKWAEKVLAQEVDALPALIQDGDLLLTKGIQRGPKQDGPQDFFMYLTMPVPRFENPTPTQKLMTVGAVRGNVAGHMSALISMKRQNPPDAESETKTEQWLETAKKMRAEHDK